MIRIAELRITCPFPAHKRKVLWVRRKVFCTGVKILPRVRANLWHQAAIKNGVQNLWPKLVVYLTGELQRVHSVLGKPINDLVIKLIAARPVKRNSSIIKRRMVNM